MGARDGSVVRRRQLGRALRELREAAGLSLEVAAPRLDWSSSKLSRIENGQQGVDVHGVRSMLDLYEVGGERWTELVELTRQTRQKGWWRAYGFGDQGYVPLEAEATVVRDFTLTYVPGLLQTADYAREIFRTELDPHTEEKLTNLVTVRMVRQQRLASAEDPVELVAILDEAVLHRTVGGTEVMRAQLARLVDAAELPTVTLQVLPAASAPTRACPPCSPYSASVTSGCRTSPMSSTRWARYTWRRRATSPGLHSRLNGCGRSH